MAMDLFGVGYGSFENVGPQTGLQFETWHKLRGSCDYPTAYARPLDRREHDAVLKQRSTGRALERHESGIGDFCIHRCPRLGFANWLSEGRLHLHCTDEATRRRLGSANSELSSAKALAEELAKRQRQRFKAECSSLRRHATRTSVHLAAAETETTSIDSSAAPGQLHLGPASQSNERIPSRRGMCRGHGCLEDMAWDGPKKTSTCESCYLFDSLLARYLCMVHTNSTPCLGFCELSAHLVKKSAENTLAQRKAIASATQRSRSRDCLQSAKGPKDALFLLDFLVNSGHCN